MVHYNLLSRLRIYTHYSQTCCKKSPLGQRKSGLSRQVALKRGSIHMNFFMMGQEKGDIVTQVTAK